MEPHIVTPKDRCPSCNGTFTKAPVPTPDQRRAAADHDNPTPLPTLADTAPQAFVDEHGALYRCSGCSYVIRAKEQQPPAKD